MTDSALQVLMPMYTPRIDPITAPSKVVPDLKAAKGSSEKMK